MLNLLIAGSEHNPECGLSTYCWLRSSQYQYKLALSDDGYARGAAPVVTGMITVEARENILLFSQVFVMLATAFGAQTAWFLHNYIHPT